MKIVFLSRCITKAGTTTHLLALGKGLIAKGHEVYAISGGPREQDEETILLEKKLNEIGVQTITIKFPLGKASEISKIKQLGMYMLVIPNAIRELRKINPDIIHVHWPVTSYIAKIYKVLFNVPFVTTLHIGGITKSPLHLKSDGVIAISKELKKEAIDKFRYNEEQCYLINNGVEEKELGESIKAEVPVICYLGSICHRKGLDVLVNALEEVLQKGNLFKVKIVGDGDIKELVDLINVKKLQNNIELLPFQDPQPIYEESDICILPSRAEGFPLVILEAMMNGLAVIRSNTEGAAEQIVHGYNGYIFENENYKELASYIIDLLENRELMKSMGEKSREKAIKEFTIDVMASKTIDAYKHVISRG